ncbi:TerB family tellurite resistance protein [Ruegeria sp. MALMAid1280]|uniref:tellurite resistance TerB family protein n=1 Tax=Ruegeria sp. MALMAid1280 TaxID=3411634 RepID=UPI003B9F8052
MFSDFLARLTQPAPDPLADDDARLALTALLVRIARSDNDYADTEMARIDKISAERYGLSPFEAAALRARAEDLEAEAPDTVRFTRAIKEAIAYDDRLAVVQAMWSVALADGQRTGEEDSLLRLVVSLLGVSDVDSALARQKVAKS